MITKSNIQEHISWSYCASRKLSAPPSKTIGSQSSYLTLQTPDALFPLFTKTMQPWDSRFPQCLLCPNPALPASPSLHPQLLFVTAPLPKTTHLHLLIVCLVTPASPSDLPFPVPTPLVPGFDSGWTQYLSHPVKYNPENFAGKKGEK